MIWNHIYHDKTQERISDIANAEPLQSYQLIPDNIITNSLTCKQHGHYAASEGCYLENRYRPRCSQNPTMPDYPFEEIADKMGVKYARKTCPEWSDKDIRKLLRKNLKVGKLLSVYWWTRRINNQSVWAVGIQNFENIGTVKVLILYKYILNILYILY